MGKLLTICLLVAQVKSEKSVLQRFPVGFGDFALIAVGHVDDT